jgi:hypothetical protein
VIAPRWKAIAIDLERLVERLLPSRKERESTSAARGSLCLGIGPVDVTWFMLNVERPFPAEIFNRFDRRR